MSEREIGLESLSRPPLYRLVGADGEDVFEEKEVGGESSKVGVLFSDRGLAEEFSADAAGFGMPSLEGLEPRELSDWGAVEVYALSGEDYVLVVSLEGTGVFHAGDVAHHASDKAGEIPLPLYLFSDERGEAPLISVETNGEELIAALFSSPEKAHAFRESAPHLDLPENLATIEDADGLRRHGLVARQAGAAYAVIDPESGLSEAIPIEELIG